MMLNAISANPHITSSSTNPSISIATTTSISGESALWTHLTLKQLAVLATSLHLVSPGALDASSGLLRDEKLLIDLDFMSRSLAGELMYYLPKVEGVENRKCRVSWTFKKSGKDGITPIETIMGEYLFLLPGENPIVRNEDEAEDLGLKMWDLPRRKSRGIAEGTRQNLM